MATRMHKLFAALEKQKDPLWDDHKRLFLSFMREAKQFDFGDEDKAAPMSMRQTLIDYSLDLIEHGIFETPYPSTYFCTSKDMSKFAGKNYNGRLDDAYLCMKADDNVYLVLQFGYLPAQDVICYCYSVELDFNKKESRCLSGYQLMNDDTMGLWYYASATKEAAQEVISWVHQSILSFVAVLNSASVELKPVSPSGTVNRRRAKQGLPPIGEVTEVHIKMNGVRYRIDGGEVGSGSSKRAHWRRGHIRRLPSGQITNVRPCLVAFTGNENVPEQIYKVTA
jgi:hypothetical protein